MELITILNRCHRFRGFVYQHAHFSADKKSIEVAVRPRKGSAAVCSRCHLPAPGYDQLAERRFEFIPLWGFLVGCTTRMWTQRRFGEPLAVPQRSFERRNCLQAACAISSGVRVDRHSDRVTALVRGLPFDRR